MNLTSAFKKVKNNELLSGSFWTAIGSGLSRVLITLGTIISSNILGVEKFGEFSITRSTINVILVLAGLNLGPVITKAVAEFSETDKNKCARIVSANYIFILSLTIILGFITYVGAEYVSTDIIGEPNLVDHFRISSFIFLFAIVFSLNESLYRGLGLYKRLGILQVIVSFSFLVFVPLGSYLSGVLGALGGYFIYAVFMAIFTIADLFRFSWKFNYNFFTFKNLGGELFAMKSLTLPIFIGSLIEAPVFWYSQVLLIKYSGIASNGIANALLQTRNLVLILPGYVSLIILPILCKTLDDKLNYKKKFRQALTINLVIATVFTLPLLIFPKFFLRMYGSDFDFDFNYVDSALAYISIPFLVASSTYHQSLVAKNKGWNSLLISIIWNSVLLIFTYVFCKYLGYGVGGFMGAMLLCIICQLLLRLYFNQN